MSGVSLATGNKAAPAAERGVDLYQTPPEAVRTLLALEAIPDAVWEPACGPGAITRELEASGRHVHSSDLHDYDWGHVAGLDFMNTDHLPQIDYGDDFGGVIDCIITNPPYMRRQPELFARHAVKLEPAKICLLLRTGFLTSQNRMSLINDTGLSRVWGFARRLPMMHREGWTGKRSSSAMDFSWFIWERGYSGFPQFKSIDWKDYQ